MTVPCGVDSKGLPIGLQLIADCFQEKKIIRAAYAYEQARGPWRAARSRRKGRKNNHGKTV